MKKLILMTSALTFVGSAAMAEITLSGEASVAYGNWETGAGPAAFKYETSATIAMEQSAGDLTYGAEITLENGSAITTGTVTDGVIWISSNFGKFSFGVDEFDELNGTLVAPGPGAGTDINGVANEGDYGDVKYEGEFGAVSVTVVADAGLGVGPGTATATVDGVAAGSATWYASIGYDAGDWNFGIETDSTGYSKVNAAFDAGNFNVRGEADTNNAWEIGVGTSFNGVNAEVAYDDTGKTSVSLDGKAGDVSWKVAGDSNGGVSASVNYSMDALSIGVAYDNDDAGTPGTDYGDEADLILTVGYAASDNLSFEVKANDVSEYEVSMTAGFTF
jgi:hypothetical protein